MANKDKLALLYAEHRDAENAVLAIFLLDPAVATKNIRSIPEEYFFYYKNRLVFSAIKRLVENDVHPDIVPIVCELEKTGDIERVGRLYVNELISSVGSSAPSIEYYLDVLKRSATLRSLVDVGTAIIGIGQDKTKAPEDAIRMAEDELQKIMRDEDARDYIHLGSAVEEHIGMLESLQRRGEHVIGVPTGFKDLDNMTTGLRDSDLIIVAGRPSMGKSSFALAMARRAALDNYSVGIFSIEMSTGQVIDRLLACEARVDLHRIRSGKLSLNDFRAIATRADSIMRAPIYIDDTPGISLSDLIYKAKRMKKEHDISILFIDYAQLISHSIHGRAREQEVAFISKSLKGLARTLNIPVVLVAQLSRAPEQRGEGSRRPILSDLRESGSLEQDADLVMFVYREDYQKNSIEERQDTIVNAEIIVAKQRNGPTGSVVLSFHKAYTDFYSQVYSNEDNPPLSKISSDDVRDAVVDFFGGGVDIDG